MVPRVLPTELLATAQVPGGGGELRCLRHDADYRIFIDRTELMSTRMLGSESALAELGIDRFGAERVRKVLVGGLGMGFTQAKALALVSSAAEVEVAELVPEIVTWNREIFGHCAGHPLRDRRTKVTVADVGEVLAGARSVYDVVLLDVDNGPEGLSRPSNSKLYGRPGIESARTALRPGGVLAVWSSGDDPAFTRRLRDAGFAVERHPMRARRTKGPWRLIWVAKLAR